MSTKKQKAPAKTGINKGIEKGVDEKEFASKVFCKKCDKEIEFTLGSKLFVKCPRCNARLERDLKDENKKANRIIKWDVLRRSKKAQLITGLVFVILGAGFNILNFFVDFMPSKLWALGLLTLIPVLLGGLLIANTKNTSASKKYKFYAWLAGWVVLAAVAVVIITTVPAIAGEIRHWLGICDEHC
jgi:uncharacterized C2H2 Zn-finger protein